MCFLLHFSTEHFQHKKREINKKFFKKFFLAKAICFFRKKDRSVWREKPCFPRPKPVSRPLILLTILRSSRLQADCPHLIHPSYNQTKIYSISLPTKQKDAARVIREDIFFRQPLSNPHTSFHTHPQHGFSSSVQRQIVLSARHRQLFLENGCLQASVRVRCYRPSIHPVGGAVRVISEDAFLPTIPEPTPTPFFPAHRHRWFHPCVHAG